MISRYGVKNKYTAADRKRIVKRWFTYKKTMPSLTKLGFSKGAGITYNLLAEWIKKYGLEADKGVHEPKGRTCGGTIIA